MLFNNLSIVRDDSRIICKEILKDLFGDDSSLVTILDEMDKMIVNNKVY